GDFFGANKGYRVRKVDVKGIISIVAGSDGRGFTGDGGPATAARLNTPTGVAVDSAGNLFIAEAGNLRGRRVDASGIISTVAGGGAIGAPSRGPTPSLPVLRPVTRFHTG